MTRLPLVACAALLALGLAPSADAAVDLCRNGVQGHRVCTDVSGVCASVGYVPPFTDFAAGAGQCPDVSAGSEGVSACEAAWAGYVTLAGFFGFDGVACAVVYEDGAGQTCVAAFVASNLLTTDSLRPVCV